MNGYVARHGVDRLDVCITGCPTRDEWIAISESVMLESTVLVPNWDAVFDARGLIVLTTDDGNDLAEVLHVMRVSGAGRITTITDSEDTAAEMAAASITAETVPFTIACTMPAPPINDAVISSDDGLEVTHG